MIQNRDTDHTAVTVIGLGLMGRALAGAFLRAGHPTTVWNRTAAKADEVVAQGGKLAGSAGAAVAASPLVIVCLSDYHAVHEILDPLAEILDGRVLVNLTSGTSGQARESAQRAARRGIAYLDGAIMAIPQAIGTADAVILYSGQQAAFDQHESTLGSLGAGTTYLGDDHGLSSLYDAAILGMMWSILNGFLQGVALLGTAGVDAAVYAPVAKTMIETMAGWVSTYARQIDDATYPALDSTIDTHAAAMEHLVHESESLGVNAELPRFIKALTGRAVADGHGSDSYAAMIGQFRKPPPPGNASVQSMDEIRW